MTTNELYSRNGLYRWEPITVDSNLVFYNNSGEVYSLNANTPLRTNNEIRNHNRVDVTKLLFGDYLPRDYVLNECNKTTNKFTPNGTININTTTNTSSNSTTSTEFNWLQSLTEDDFILSLDPSVDLSKLLFQFDTDGVEFILQPFMLFNNRDYREHNDHNEHRYNNGTTNPNYNKNLYYLRIKLNNARIKNRQFNLTIKDDKYGFVYATVRFNIQSNHTTTSVKPWNYMAHTYYRHPYYGNGYAGVVGLDKTLNITKTNAEEVIVVNNDGYRALNLPIGPNNSNSTWEMKSRLTTDISTNTTARYDPILLNNLVKPNTSNSSLINSININSSSISGDTNVSNLTFNYRNVNNYSTGESLIWMSPIIGNKNNAKAGKNVYIPYVLDKVSDTILYGVVKNNSNAYIASTDIRKSTYNLNSFSTYRTDIINPDNIGIADTLKIPLTQSIPTTLIINNQYSTNWYIGNSIHPKSTLDVNMHTYKWDNQTNDAMTIMPYIYSGYLCVKVLPHHNPVNKITILGYQTYMAGLNDRNYKQNEIQFEITGTSNITPIDLDAYDFRLRCGETFKVRVFTLGYDNIHHTSTNNIIIEQDKSKDDFNVVTYTFKATSPGDTTIRFYSNKTGYTEGNVSCNVKVYGVPGQDTATLEMDPDPNTGKGYNKRIIMLAVGESKNIGIKANRCDNIIFTGIDNNIAIATDLTKHNKYGYSREGSIQITGISPGVTTLTIKSVVTYNDGKSYAQKSGTVEIHVIPRDTFDIKTDLIKAKIKIDVKRNNKPFKWFNLTAFTNANYLVVDIPFQPSFFVINTEDYKKYGIKDIERKKFPIEMGGGPKDWKTNLNYNITNHNQIPTINQLVFTSLPLYDYLDVTIGPKLKRGKYIIYLHALTPRPCTIRKTIEIPIKVTNNIEVPKDEIWVAMQHKQLGIKDNDEDYDYQYYTVLKWLERKNLDQVYKHRLNLPNRSGRLLTYEELEINAKYTKRYFNYMEPRLPSKNVNPKYKDALWLDTTTGESWWCKDITEDDNVWISETGKMIGAVNKLDYSKPGEKGFGVGPMSYDLHSKYGIEPLEGCFDKNSPNYGNYKDKFGNIYVCIPKHYIKISK